MVTSKIIPPKDSGEINVSFRSGKYKGEVSKTVFVESNDPTNPTVYIRVKAFVLPEIKGYFFYSQNCEACEQVMKDVFPKLREKYSLYIVFMDLDIPENYDLLVKLEEKCNDTGNEVPVIAIGEHILGGKKEIKKNFEKLLQRYRKDGCELPTLETKSDTVEIQKQ